MRTRFACVMALAALLAPGLSGCARMTLAAQSPPPADSNAALMDYIGDQPFVSAESGYRAAHLLWKGQPFAGDFPALCSELQQHDIIADFWDFAPNECLDRASVGYIVCRACDIQGGLNWTLTGLGRYAWKELQYRRIAQPSSELGLVSGGEFLGILVRAEDYLHGVRSASASGKLELGERR